MNTAEKLIQLRYEKGLTQAELGKELNIALSSIQNYENINKPRIPEAKLLLKIAKYYDVSLEYLLDDELNNRKQENIEIGKELGLTDETIENIKKINDEGLNNILNLFISKNEFMQIVEKYNLYYKSTFYLNNILTLKELDNQIEFCNQYNRQLSIEESNIIEYFKNCQKIILETDERIKKEYGLFSNIITFFITDKDCKILYKMLEALIKQFKAKGLEQCLKTEEYKKFFGKLKEKESHIREYREYLIYCMNQIINTCADEISSDYLEKEVFPYPDKRIRFF